MITGDGHDCKIEKIAIIHDRTKFYGTEIYWYQLYNGNIPVKFIKVTDTQYYEYGGKHSEALLELIKNNYIVIEGKEI